MAYSDIGTTDSEVLGVHWLLPLICPRFRTHRPASPSTDRTLGDIYVDRRMPGILRQATPRFDVHFCSGLPRFQPPVHPRYGRQRHCHRYCPLAGRQRRSGTSHRLQEPPTDKARGTVLRHTPGAVGHGDFEKQYRPYLTGQRFLLCTDHGFLTWLRNFREPEGQLARWLERLQELDFDIVHRRGKKTQMLMPFLVFPTCSAVGRATLQKSRGQFPPHLCTPRSWNPSQNFERHSWQTSFWDHSCEAKNRERGPVPTSCGV